MCEFFRNGEAICLNNVYLVNCELSSRRLTTFCEVLNDKLCPKLTLLNLGGNNIAGEGIKDLCYTITKPRLWKLTKLHLWKCLLNNECVPLLCELLAN